MPKTVCTSTQIPSCGVFIIDGEAYIAVIDYFLSRHDEITFEEEGSWGSTVAVIIQGSACTAKSECGCYLCGSPCCYATSILRQGVGSWLVLFAQTAGTAVYVYWKLCYKWCFLIQGLFAYRKMWSRSTQWAMWVPKASWSHENRVQSELFYFTGYWCSSHYLCHAWRWQRQG